MSSNDLSQVNTEKRFITKHVQKRNQINLDFLLRLLLRPHILKYTMKHCCCFTLRMLLLNQDCNHPVQDYIVTRVVTTQQWTDGRSSKLSLSGGVGCATTKKNLTGIVAPRIESFFPE